MRWLAAAVCALGGCHEEDWLQYSWNDRRVLCSQPVDDMTQDPEWDAARDQLDIARDNRSVALLHAHVPNETVTVAGLERLFSDVAERGIAYVTYPELVPGEKRSGVALGFDDQNVESWYGIRELMQSHGARVTFFVSRFAGLTAEQRRLLAELASDGHAIEAHGVHHLNAETLIPMIGIDAYIAEEVLPSITILQDAGYQPTAFAYPFGRNTEAADAAVLELVDKVRVSPGPCPY
jgi:peptidoglycan/xylan/chitin deacetylase (PgdA/CDA1 family)